MSFLSRREFLVNSATLTAAGLGTLSGTLPAAFGQDAIEPIIDIHQHTNYWQRDLDSLIAHQKAMGVTQTILLPAGSAVSRASTADGKHNGLGGVGAGGVDENTSVTPELLKEWEGICASARQDLMVNINKGEASTNYQCYAKP